MGIASVRENVSVKSATRAQLVNSNVPGIASERCALSFVNAATLIGKSDNRQNGGKVLKF